MICHSLHNIIFDVVLFALFHQKTFQLLLIHTAQFFYPVRIHSMVPKPRAAYPSVFRRTAAHSCLHGVLADISQRAQKVRFRIDNFTFIPSLEKMSRKIVFLVVEDSVPGRNLSENLFDRILPFSYQ